MKTQVYLVICTLILWRGETPYTREFACKQKIGLAVYTPRVHDRVQRLSCVAHTAVGLLVGQELRTQVRVVPRKRSFFD